MKNISLFLPMFFLLSFSCNNTDYDKTEKQNSVIEQNTQINPSDKSEKIDNLPVQETGAVNMKQINEDVVFSFNTSKGKTMNIIIDKEQKYMAYRFGDASKVELQFPEKLENTFDQFTYNYYMRGGGPSNEGLDLNYIIFQGETHKFIVFEEYAYTGQSNDDQSLSVGIRIIDLKTNKETIIKGISSTAKGTLISFRSNDLVRIEQGGI